MNPKRRPCLKALKADYGDATPQRAAADWARTGLAASAALLAGCAEAPTEPTSLATESTPALPAFVWLQGQWYSDNFDKPFSEEVVSCTGRFVGTLTCYEGDYGWRGPAYMQVRQDTVTGLIEGAFEYIGRDYYDADVAGGDLGISDTVDVTITISGPYVSGLLTFQGRQPRGVPEDGFTVVMPEYEMGCYQTTVSRSETIRLIPKEGVWVSSRITCEDQFADSTGSYHKRVTYGGEGLFRPAKEPFWPGYYAGEWSLGDRRGLATVTLSHVAHWFRTSPEGAVLEVTFHGWDPCEAERPFRWSGTGETGWQTDGNAEFSFDPSGWDGRCNRSLSESPGPCIVPADFAMVLRAETRVADMSLILDCGEWGDLSVNLDDAPMTAPSPGLVEWRLTRGTG